MDDDKKVVVKNGGGVFSTIWIISCVILYIQPKSFPLWLMDLCNIIFWVGIVLMGVFIILFVMFVIFFLLMSD